MRISDWSSDVCSSDLASGGPETMRMLEKHIMLNVVDQNWKEHLARMDYLRQGIHLRSYAQKQPKQEYKREAFELFSDMLSKVKREVISLLARVRIRSEEEVAALEAQERAQAEAAARQMQFQHADSGGLGADEEAEQARLAQANAAARSEEHTSELQSLMRTSYAVFCLKQNTTEK